MTLQGRPKFISEAISRLPTKTPEEVHEHETWYREFLNHQELKRLAIKAWKNKKQVRFICMHNPNVDPMNLYFIVALYRYMVK